MELGSTAAPVAVEVIRGGIVECVHRAHIAVVDRTGELLAWAGDPQVMMLPRSTLKPLLAVGLVELGFAPERQEQLAVAASSHSGEAFHVEAVTAILSSIGLGPDALANTADWPFDADARDAYIASGGAKDSVHANCSGKHAGMLAACLAQGWDIDDYLSLEHPLQQALAAAVSAQVGQQLSAVTVDGCGAPVWAMPLRAMATGFAGLAAAGRNSAAATVADAMRAHPEYVGGSHRDVTELMRAVPGLVAKDGAEAVYCAGLPDGRGVAIKVEDGGGRARPAVIAGTLSELGIDGLDEIEHWERVLGGGDPQGEVRSQVRLTNV